MMANRANWKQAPEHEILLVDELLKDDRVTAETVMANNMLIANGYDKNQVTNKLNDLRHKVGVTEKALKGHKKALEKRQVTKAKKIATATKKQQQQDRLAASKRKSALNLHNRLKKAGIFDAGSQSSEDSDESFSTSSSEGAKSSESSSSYKTKPQKKKAKLLTSPAMDLEEQVHQVAIFDQASKPKLAANLEIDSTPSSLQSPLRWSDLEVAIKAPKDAQLPVPLTPPTPSPEYVWFDTMGRKNLLVYNLAPNAEAVLALDKNNPGSCRLIIKRKYDSLLSHLYLNYHKERSSLPTVIRDTSEISERLELPDVIPRESVPLKETHRAEGYVVWRFNSQAISAATHDEEIMI